MSVPNYWIYRIHRQGLDGKPRFTASYVAGTDLKSVERDIASKQSYLRRHLEYFFRINAERFAKEHQLNAQALLGGLIANEECSVRFGIFLPMEPPPTQSLRSDNLPPKLEDPVKTECGVTVWLAEVGDTNFEG